VPIGNRKCRLRRAPLARQRGVTADADDALLAALAERGNQRRPLDEVEPREAVELIVGESSLYAEEAKVDRTGAQRVEVLDQALAVIRPDGADVDRSTIAEELFDRVEARIVDAALYYGLPGVFTVRCSRGVEATVTSFSAFMPLPPPFLVCNESLKPPIRRP